MPVEQPPSPPSRPAARPSDGAKLIRYHDYIDGKIESTRRMVKVVDLATAFVELAVALLAFLLLYAVVEHWVVPGGFSFTVRCALFGTLVVAGVAFAYRRLWPLCVRAINPVYAAQTIEHGSPSLKNGLINLLLFRQRRTEIPDAVYRTLEEQAAHGLTRVPVDTAVDRSQLIRLGYVLLAIVAIGALYKVLSPKDPFVAAERVLMPWAEIVPASRVIITAITPGAATISRGESVDVAAEVRGLGDDDAVVLRYTTDDGQAVGRVIPMKAAAGRVNFTCRLADESEGPESVGVTRSLSYRLEAGDARSLDYAITVVPAASILVERVEYDYPTYTGYVDRSVDGVGDIQAIEGTKVTVHARANGPIREANVDFNADGRRDLTMTAVEEVKARASFELALRDDRQTPKHASYVLRFTNEEGRANHDPVKHSINVERDFEPEADIRVPEEKSRDVRLDENVVIEVAARDPDFALSAVRLRGEATGRVALNEQLLKSEHRGQLTANYRFTPNDHGLKAGDILEYWVEASDNRTPKPSVTATERKVLRIVSPNPAQPPPNQVAQNDRQKRDPQQDQQQGEQKPGDKEQGRQGEQGGKAGQQQQGNEGGQGRGQQGQAQPGQGQQGQQNNKGEGQQQGNETQPHGQQGEQRPGDKEQGRQGEQSAQAGGQSKSNEEQGGQRDQQQKSNGEQTGAGNRADQGETGQERGGNQQNGEQQAKPGEEKSPVSSEGDNDAEAFDRIQKHLEHKGELKKDQASSAEEKNGGETQDKSQPEQGGQRQGDMEKGRQGESGNKQQENRQQKSDQGAEAGSKDGKQGAEPKNGDSGQKKGEGKQDNAKGGGAETRGDDLKNGEKPNGDQKSQQEKSPGGEQTASKGDPGAGEEKNSQGAPNSKPEMKPTAKPEQSPSKGDQSNESEPPAGANSKKESDSHGEQGGDKAGGGEEGGGQKAPRDGTGSAGQNQSADNGAGQSGEKGKGANSSEGGKDAKSSEKTGSSDGKTQGEGSQQRQGVGGKADKEKGRQGDKEDGSKADKQSGEQGEKSDGRQQGAGDRGKDSAKGDEGADNAAGGGSTEGGGKHGAVAQPSITGETPEGDAANLEYARKQTDLVVDKLADQLSKKKVDDKLLKDLGWSEAELRRFVERWQQRRDAANKNDPSAEAARRELDDALRSLGLQRDKLQQGAVKKDTMRDLQQGYRGPVPAEYKERLRAYNQGVSRARPDGE